MIEEVQDFFDDVKSGFGKKGLYIFIAGAVVFGLYHLLKKDDTEEVYYAPDNMTGYPTVGGNSDVVIESVNSTLDSFTSEILGAIQDSENAITGEINTGKNEIIDNSQATNNYINDGLNKWNDISSKVESVDTEPLTTVKPTQAQNTTTIKSGSTANKSTSSTNSGTLMTYDPSTGTSTKATQAVLDAVERNRARNTQAQATAKKAQQTKTTPVQTESTYNYTTKKGLNTSTSIVDALKASGADSSFEHRKQIAEANGITNYTGTASQNKALLASMKAGTLKKA